MINLDKQHIDFITIEGTADDECKYLKLINHILIPENTPTPIIAPQKF